MARGFVALYDDMATAQIVVEELLDAGFPDDSISLITNDVTGEYSRYMEELDVKRPNDVDAHEGASFGAVIGALVGLGAAVIPGVGPILAAGPLAAALFSGGIGAAVGAAAGSLVASLVDLDMTAEEAGYYAEGVRRGGTLVVVNVLSDDWIDAAEDILYDYDPVDINARVDLWRESGWQGFDPAASPYTLDEINREREAVMRRNL